MLPWPALEKYKHTLTLPQPVNGVADLSLFYYAAGEPYNPAMVLLHGLGDEADTWRHIIEPLAENWYVIAPDLPGFGRSAKPDVHYTLSFLNGAILGLLQALNIQSPVLAGSSLGGMLAHSIALQQPEQVRGLVLVDGALLARVQPLSVHLLLFLAPGLGEWLYTRLRKNPQAAYETLRPYYANLDELPQADRDFLYQHVIQRVGSDEQRRAYFSTLRGLATSTGKLQHDLPTKLAALQNLPTLILWGEQDQINPVENGRLLAQIQPGARLKLFPNSGHLPHQERPAEALEAILGDERLKRTR